MNRKIDMITIFEGVLMLYFAVGLFLAFVFQDYGMVPFLMLLVFGFGFVFYCGISHLFLKP